MGDAAITDYRLGCSSEQERRPKLRAPALRVEDERALQRVVAFDVEVDTELFVLRAVTWRLANEYRRAGDGREYGIGQCRGRAAGALVRFELGVTGLAELDRPLSTLDVERDGHVLDGHNLGDELHQLADRPAQLTGVDVEDRLFLLRRYLLVEIHGGAPVAFENVARHMRNHRDRPCRHVDVVDRAAFVETPGDERVAGAEVRILADPAGAQHATIADFEQASFEVIAHGCLRHVVRDAGPRPAIGGWLSYAHTHGISIWNIRDPIGVPRRAARPADAPEAAPSRPRRAPARAQAGRTRTASPSPRPNAGPDRSWRASA